MPPPHVVLIVSASAGLGLCALLAALAVDASGNPGRDQRPARLVSDVSSVDIPATDAIPHSSSTSADANVVVHAVADASPGHGTSDGPKLLATEEDCAASGGITESVESNSPAEDTGQKRDNVSTAAEQVVDATPDKISPCVDAAEMLAEYSRLMGTGKYNEAAALAQRGAGAESSEEEVLSAAAGVARTMATAPSAWVRGARTLIGCKTRLRLARGSMTVVVKGVTEDGLTYVTSFSVNGVTRERVGQLVWDELHLDQRTKLALLGKLEIPPSVPAVASAYKAWHAEDFEAMRRSINEAGTHPLVPHLEEALGLQETEIARRNAMERSARLMAKRSYQAAADECKKALELKPGDPEASAMLKEIDSFQGLTLDLGGGVTMECVYIEPGTFVMGGHSDAEGRFQASELPEHTVTITKGFYLGKYEVTQAQYQAIMGRNPSRSTRDPNCPVDSTEWDDEIAFCNKVAEKTGQKVRLPTEAEWEYACRAGTDTDWSFGNDPAALTEHAWFGENSGGRSHQVGQKKPNPWGVHDIYGNVSERVADRYERSYYASSPKEDPTGAKVGFSCGNGGTTILRGGNWKHGAAGRCRSGTRLRGGGYGFYDNWGFRVACTRIPAVRGSGKARHRLPHGRSKEPDGPGVTPGADAPDALPKTSQHLVPNGGFEKVHKGGKSPSGWAKHDWGEGRGRWSVRSSLSNPHNGDRSIVVRSLDDDCRPGMCHFLNLEKGTYELTFWACADVGANVTVGACLAGKDLVMRSIGEEWAKYSARVTIADKKRRAELGIFTTTKGVRVWFDDVEVKARPDD